MCNDAARAEGDNRGAEGAMEWGARSGVVGEGGGGWG